VGAPTGAALGAVLLHSVSLPNISGLWLGAFGGFVIAGALTGGLIARTFGDDLWVPPMTVAVIPTALAVLGALLAHGIGTQVPTVAAAIIGAVLVWGAGALGDLMLNHDPGQSGGSLGPPGDDEWPCGN
jgi:hypothetical protein